MIVRSPDVNSSQNNYLAITLLAANEPDVLPILTHTISDCGCSVVECSMAVLADRMAAILLIHGNWNTLARTEVQLQKLRKTLDADIRYRRCPWPEQNETILPYAIEVIAPDQVGIIAGLTAFFTAHRIGIEQLSSRSYRAPHTATPMCLVNLVIGIPAEIHIAMLREEFFDFCDDHNLDAVMEPVKS